MDDWDDEGMIDFLDRVDDGLSDEDGSGVADYRRRDRSAQEPPFNAGNVTARRETAKAILVDRGNGRPAEWCPKGQIARTSQVKKAGDVGELYVTAWIAREKGWSR